MKPTTQETGGTSSFDHEIRATPNQLRKILGEPSFEEPDPDDKVSLEWDMETDKGTIFIVYDYKEYDAPPSRYPNRFYNFHIGARNKQESLLAWVELTNALKNPKNAPKKTAYELWASKELTNLGGFQTKLFEAYQHASGDNQAKLQLAYPEWF